jgi:hypothetical protein
MRAPTVYIPGMPDDPMETARQVLAAAGIEPSDADLERMTIFVLAGRRPPGEAPAPRVDTEPQLVQVVRPWPRN